MNAVELDSSALLDADDSILAGFHERLLLGDGRANLAALPEWLEPAYRTFRQHLTSPDYPCYFGAAAEQRGELYYTYVTAETLEQMPATLATFLEAADRFPKERRNLTLFFAPDAVLQAHEQYRQRFWRFLRFLRVRDHCPWPSEVPSNPDHPLWEFAFAGRTIFVFCSAPSYRRRCSRALGPGMIILMQPRSSFFGIEGDTPAGVAARSKTRQLLTRWDQIPPHPDLGVYGDTENREWKQYFLPDDNRPSRGHCPFTSHAPLASLLSSNPSADEMDP
jgi:hypothetical protein